MEPRQQNSSWMVLLPAIVVGTVAASDYDYGSDTLPFLVANSNCIVWTSGQEPLRVADNDRFRVVTYELVDLLGGNCDREQVNIDYPTYLDPSVGKNTILFVDQPLSNDDAEQRGCTEVCDNVRSLISDQFGIVPYTPERHAAIVDFISLGDNSSDIDWAARLADSSQADGFLQNSAIYLVSSIDPTLEQDDTRRFYESIFSAERVGIDVKLFGISAITNSLSTTSSRILLNVAENADLPSFVRIRAHDVLTQAPIRVEQSSINSSDLANLSSEIQLLRNQPSPWLQYIEARLRRLPNEAESFVDARREELSALRTMIENPRIELDARSTAIQMYVDRIQDATDERLAQLPVALDSYELELQIRRANALLRQASSKRSENDE